MQQYKATGAPAPSLQQMLNSPAVRKKPIPQLLQPHQATNQQQRTGEPREKFMRLRGKMRILQNAYLQGGDIADRDADVVFVCSDGKVRSHKVVLVSASPFFNDLFHGQKAGSMSSVLIPDITAATMKIILLLAYKDNLTLTKKQMREVAHFLPLFGMDLNSFVFDETNLADQSGAPATSLVKPQQPIRRPPPMISRPNPPPLQQGQKLQRQIGSITISGTSGVVQPNRNAVTTSSSGDDEDYKFQFQGYDPNTPPPLKQIRLTTSPQGLQFQLKKAIGVPQPTAAAVPVGNFRRIAPKPPVDDLLPIQPAMDMTVGNQEIQFEDNDEDDGQVLDPEKGRLMIQEWMKNVGQPDDDEDEPSGLVGPSSRATPPAAPRNQCLICNNIFENPEKWRWHESHHVGLGIFKCAFCDELFSTSRKVYQHEMMEHGVSGSSGTTPLEEPPGIPSDFQIVQGRKRRFQTDGENQQEGGGGPRMTLVRTANGTHFRRVPTPISKKLLSKYAKKPVPASGGVVGGGAVVRNSASPNIAIGNTQAEVDDRKMKQLHWVYICNKCQSCSDSLGKAQAHYNKCFTDKSVLFETSVMKYRQGFYGRCRCPLCPRRYTTNNGFTIHCGHMHNDFRRKFQHCSQNDTVACVSCRKKFELPFQFHAHLGDDGECNAVPEYSANDKSTKWIGTEMPGERNAGRRESKASPAASKGPPKLSPQTTIAHGRTGMESQARSTRLANRRTMTKEEDVPEEEFEPAACPICGSTQKKIVEHLNSAHKEMELSVSRISNTAFRCLKCAISFGISDLVSHDTYCCIRSKQFQHIKERKLQHPKETTEKNSPVAGSGGSGGTPSNGVSHPTIPDGIGTSPVDTMEHAAELTSKDLLRKAMRCGVCGRINAKLGTIGECMKSHGVYRCALCFNSYLDKNTYSTHLRTVHTLDNGRLKCSICDRAQFVNAGQVAGHLLNAHWLPIFKVIYQEDREAESQVKEEKLMPPVGEEVKTDQVLAGNDSKIIDEADEEREESNNEGEETTGDVTEPVTPAEVSGEEGQEDVDIPKSDMDTAESGQEETKGEV